MRAAVGIICLLWVIWFVGAAVLTVAKAIWEELL